MSFKQAYIVYMNEVMELYHNLNYHLVEIISFYEKYQIAYKIVITRKNEFEYVTILTKHYIVQSKFNNYKLIFPIIQFLN